MIRKPPLAASSEPAITRVKSVFTPPMVARFSMRPKTLP